MRGKEKRQTAHGELGRDVLRESWAWFLGLGILLALLGVFALGSATAATRASVMIFGWALVVGGALQTAHAVWRHGWSGSLLDLASGVLFLIVGTMTVTHPLQSTVALSLVLAVFLVVRGAIRLLAGVSHRFPHRLWVLVHGAITLALGSWLWTTWPESSLWMLGVFVGLDLLLEGVTLALLAMAARQLPERPLEREGGRPVVTPPPREATAPRGPIPAT